jgi:hypothetical protein
VGRAKEKKRESYSKKEKEIQRERRTERQSECQFKRNCHVLCGDYRRETERDRQRLLTLNIDYNKT